jgi:hypothetical protein
MRDKSTKKLLPYMVKPVPLKPTIKGWMRKFNVTGSGLQRIRADKLLP